MLFNNFVEETRNWWETYLNKVQIAQRNGNLDANGRIVLYPNILLATRCHGHYVAELVGATEEFIGLSVKRHNEESIYRYLSQFDAGEPEPLVHLNSSRHGFRFLCLANDADFEAVKTRFPHIELYESKIKRSAGHGSTISFGPDFSSCMIENCILVNTREHLFRCKRILSAYIFKSGISKAEVLDLYKHTTRNNEVKSVHTTREKGRRLIISGQLQSIALLPKLRETTIGEFMKLHPELVRGAFKTEHFEYEPYLKWIEHDGTCTDIAINPDLLVKRNDGYYDIYDLKTAAVEKTKLTKGPRNRRRFIDYVEQGISQLANYREYFLYPKNAEHAKQKYGIEVNDPNLILVIGSWENVNIDEANQACRKYNNVQIIDYDTLCHTFIGTSEGHAS